MIQVITEKQIKMKRLEDERDAVSSTGELISSSHWVRMKQNENIVGNGELTALKNLKPQLLKMILSRK